MTVGPPSVHRHTSEGSTLPINHHKLSTTPEMASSLQNEPTSSSSTAKDVDSDNPSEGPVTAVPSLPTELLIELLERATIADVETCYNVGLSSARQRTSKCLFSFLTLVPYNFSFPDVSAASSISKCGLVTTQEEDGKRRP